jgi:hypothetical protein
VARAWNAGDALILRLRAKTKPGRTDSDSDGGPALVDVGGRP